MKPIFYKNVTTEEAHNVKKNLLSSEHFFDQFSIFETALKNNNESEYDLIAGFGSKSAFNLNNNSLEFVDKFLNQWPNDWKIIQLNYNLFKSIYTEVKSKHKNIFDFKLLNIIIPETIVVIKNGELLVYGNYKLIEPFLNFNIENKNKIQSGKNFLIEHVNYDTYSNQFNKIQKYLKRGDIYEVNYCIPFHIKTKNVNLIDIYSNQKKQSPAPFSCFIKDNNNYLLSASPERFIKKNEQTICCYPMKGTIRKSESPIQNELLKTELYLSEKERAENVMIVDLTRNDLSKIAEKGSVSVKELFGIYEFPQVYQMISTVQAEIKKDTPFSSILKSLFPMGSMTGAPKLNAIKIIDEVECFSRELFSGSVGYIDPNGDFDFNVVIRSILYNSEKQQALIAAGGAITVHSNAVDEYNECLLKANANLQLLGIDLSEIHLHKA